MFDDLLKEYKEPFSAGEKLPYVVFGHTVIEGKGMAEIPTPALATLRLIGSHKHPDKITYYASKKGWKLLKYWLPKDRDGNTVADFRETEARIQLLLGNEKRTADLESEKRALEKKVEELLRAKNGQK